MDDSEPIRLNEHHLRVADIEPDAIKVLRRLHDFGFYAYLVGGSVRDLLLGRTPKDFDVVTSAQPREIRRLFRRCRLVGRRFRLAHIIGAHGYVVETATFRAKPTQDEEAQLITDDNRFGTPRSDAYRRDFTVNALFYDLARNEVIDYVGGLEDLDSRVLRTIGDPVNRFREDPVRMLRAVKFAARLDFVIDDESRDAVISERVELSKAALPRIYEEFVRMLWSGAACRSFELLDELRLMEILVPECTPVWSRVGGHTKASAHALLKSLDRFSQSQRDLPNGLGIAVVFWPILSCTVDELGSEVELSDYRPLVETLTRPFAIRLSVPRRTMETAIAVLEGQFRLPWIRNRRARRLGFARNPHYAAVAAMAMLRIDAGEMSAEDTELWTTFLDEFPPPKLTKARPRQRRKTGRRGNPRKPRPQHEQ